MWLSSGEQICAGLLSFLISRALLRQNGIRAWSPFTGVCGGLNFIVMLCFGEPNWQKVFSEHQVLVGQHSILLTLLLGWWSPPSFRD